MRYEVNIVQDGSTPKSLAEALVKLKGTLCKSCACQQVELQFRRFADKCVAHCTHCTLHIRVSQKNQKSEFWNVPYPSGFHRLDEPPEKISAL